MSKKFGIEYLAVDGVKRNIKKDTVEVCKGGEKRTLYKGADGRGHGFEIEPLTPFVEYTETFPTNESVTEFTNKMDSVIVLKYRNGRKYQWIGAAYCGDLSEDPITNSLKVRFEALEDAEEFLP